MSPPSQSSSVADSQAPPVGLRSAPTEWFKEQVQPHEPALRAYLLGRLASKADLDDIIQESFIRLLKVQPSGRIRLVRAYLFATARNLAIRVSRKRRIFLSTSVNELSEWQLLDGESNGAELTNERDRLNLVADAVGQLPARCGRIVGLAIVEGLSADQIADRLRISESTVRVQLARGIRKCASYLREANGASDNKWTRIDSTTGRRQPGGGGGMAGAADGGDEP